MRRLLPAALLVLLLTGVSLSRVDDDTSPIERGPAIAEHVVVISIDGLRPDAIDEAGAQTLRALIRRGAYCPKAQTVRPSITLPGHTSMLTGLDTWRHGVISNDDQPGHVAVPTVFALARRAGLSTAMFFSKFSLNYLADPARIDTVFGPVPQQPSARLLAPESAATAEEAARRAARNDVTPERLAAAFADAWGRKAYALSVAHIREPDRTGHREGWMSPAYLDAVRAADRAVGSMVESIALAGVLETTAIIVTADHGGGRGLRRHVIRSDPGNPENVTIPWICVAPGVRPGLLIDRVVRVYDTMPTALAFLGIPVPPQIDGRPVAEVLPPSSAGASEHPESPGAAGPAVPAGGPPSRPKRQAVGGR
jgi:predicted AlkP superfamily pyrophosphatase or phosphodiesterase